MTIESQVSAVHVPGRRRLSPRELITVLRQRLLPGGERGLAQRAAMVAFAIRVLSAGIAYLSWPGMHHRTDIAAG